jgi:hypothetical protein
MSVGLVVLLALQSQASPYSDTATAALVAKARERHRQQDIAVRDYRATVLSRLEVGVGRGQYPRILPVGAQEQEAELYWRAPNDLRLVALGRRTASAYPNVEIGVSWTRPWFVPRFLGDSIRLLGGRGFPRRAGVHPLAPDAASCYRYAISDSMELVLPGRTVRAIGVTVTPTCADESLIAGVLWLDAETAETVRLTFVFVGRHLWVDSSGAVVEPDSQRARRASALAARILTVSADLEYGLYGQRYWLPYRQVVTLDVSLPWVTSMVVPIRFITTFRAVGVNGGDWPGFTTVDSGSAAPRRCTLGVAVRAPGSGGPIGLPADCVSAGTWAGGRYEIDVPRDSVLLAYRGWSDPLRLDHSGTDAEELEAMRRLVAGNLADLPPALTGRQRLRLAVDDLAEITRYNRAEGTALGAGLEGRLGRSFVSVMTKVRYAFTDRRLQGSVTLRRELPGSRAEVAVFREMRDADPLAPGLTGTNSFAAAFLARDDGDYLFVQGAEVGYRRPWKRSADLALTLRLARESAPLRRARSELNDLLGGTGVFRNNGPVVAGTFATVTAEASGGPLSGAWSAGTELSVGPLWHARAWVSGVARTRLPVGLDLTASGWTGAGLGDSLPQRDFRVGGARTLRGFPASTLRGASAWSVGADVAVSGWSLSPVVFADIGQAAARALRFGSRPSVSTGVGLSLLGGTLRLNAAKPLRPAAAWRLDLVLNAVR